MISNKDNSKEQPLYTQAQTQALGFFLRQYKTVEIAETLDMSPRTVQQWISKFKWKELRDDTPIELMTRQRIAYLLWIEKKHDSQIKELESLLADKRKRDEIERKSYRRSSSTEDSKKRGRPKNQVKNDISGITKDILDEYRERIFFKYQKDIHNQKNNDELNETRFYLKSRQIGLTFYFAYEAFEDAILTGDNQVFLSASDRKSVV